MNQNKGPAKFPCIIHGHTTTWHDGGIAILLPNGSIYALSSERVGNRYKHNWDSKLAYDYLKSALKRKGCKFGSETDYFKEPINDLEQTGHHFYHAASVFFASPFKEAAILVIDGQGPEEGKLASTTIWNGSGRELVLIEAPYLTDGTFATQSIGHFYTAIGALAGMQNLDEEGKTMGLAAYGKPSRFLEYFRCHAYSKSDGSYYIDPKFVLAILGNTLGPRFYGWKAQSSEIQHIWDELLKLKKYPMRRGEENITRDDMEVAYAGQVIIEEIILGLAARAKHLTKSKYICLAGGVALNSVVNGKVARSGMFQDLYVFPAPGDDGQAMGKLLYHIRSQGIDIKTQIKTAYLGPEYSLKQIKSAIKKYSERVLIASKGESLFRETVTRLADGQVIAWFQGRSELGPRALGHRSILADPRRKDMRDHINYNVKEREWYRPLAPVVIEEEAKNFFEVNQSSPFMSIVVRVRQDKQALIPAVVHVDGSARLQTIDMSQDQKFYRLVKEFGQKTGIPVLINTSFNRKNEPIVETPEDALAAFISMNLDALVLDRYLLTKY